MVDNASLGSRRGDARESTGVAHRAIERARLVAHTCDRVHGARTGKGDNHPPIFVWSCAPLRYSESVLEWIEARYMSRAVEPMGNSSVVDELAKRRRARKNSQHDSKRPREGEQETGIEQLLKLQIESNERIARESQKIQAQLVRENREHHKAQIGSVRGAAEFQNNRITALEDELGVYIKEILRLQHQTQASLKAASATPSRNEMLVGIGLEFAQHLLMMLKAATRDE